MASKNKKKVLPDFPTRMDQMKQRNMMSRFDGYSFLGRTKLAEDLIKGRDDIWRLDLMTIIHPPLPSQRFQKIDQQCRQAYLDFFKKSSSDGLRLSFPFSRRFLGISINTLWNPMRIDEIDKEIFDLLK